VAVHPLQASGSSARPQVSNFQSLAASLASLCSLFRAPVLYFQQLAASFPKTPGVGGPPCRLTPRPHGGYWENRAGVPNHEHGETNVGESAWPAQGPGRVGRLRQDSLYRGEKDRRIPRLQRNYPPARSRVLPPKSRLPDARFRSE